MALARCARAIRKARMQSPSLIVLDLMLPEVDGLEVCKILRRDAGTAAIPILMLTAKAAEVDRVLGLELGADDYVTKPFNPRELRARIKAVLRRREAEAVEKSSVLRVHDIVIHPGRHATWYGDDTQRSRAIALLNALLGLAALVVAAATFLADSATASCPPRKGSAAHAWDGPSTDTAMHFPVPFSRRTAASVASARAVRASRRSRPSIAGSARSSPSATRRPPNSTMATRRTSTSGCSARSG